MSTADRTQYRRRKLVRDVEDSSSFEQPPKRGRKILLIVAGLLVAGLWFAPWLIAKSGLLHWAVARAADGYNLDVRFGSASLGWISGIELENLKVSDRQGTPLLQVAAVDVDRALWRLALSQSDLGTVRIERPLMEVKLRADGSNIEDLLNSVAGEDATPSEPSTEASSPPPALRLEIIDGTILLHDEVAARTWKIAQWGLTLEAPDPASAPLKAKSSALVEGDVQTGRVQAELSVPWSIVAGTPNTSPAEITLQTENLPAAISDALARRFAPGTRTSGTINVALQTSYAPADDKSAARTSVRGRMVADQLALATPALGHDRLQLARLEVPCQLDWNGDQLRVDQLAAACDLGQASFQGTVDTARGLMASLTSQPYSVDAQVDLARLAKALPETVRLRQDTQISSGVVQLQLQSTPGAEGLTWNGHLVTTNVVAMAQGRQITWDQPIEVTLAAHETPQGFVVDDLFCQSEFLELQGSGASDFVTASASFDLDKLAAEAGRFIDLSQVDLAGDGWAHLTWKRRLDGRFEADSEVQLEKFRLIATNWHPWSEEKLNVAVTASGLLVDGSPKQLDTARLTVIGGQDQLEAWLASPVKDVSAASAWPLEMRLNGILENWVPRLEPFVGSLAGWDLTGACQMAAQGVYSSDRISLTRGWIDVRPFHAWGSGLFIDEPQMQLQATADYDQKTGAVRLTNTTLHSPAIVAEAKDISVAMPADAPMQATGALNWQGDLHRLARWTQDPALPPTTQYWGRVQGQLNFTHDPQALAANLATTITDLVAASQSGQTVREPKVDLALNCTYDREADQLKIGRAALASQALGCDMSGSLSKLSSERYLDLAGKLNYDFAQLRPMLEPYLGAQVQIAGRETRNIALQWGMGSAATPAPNAPPEKSSLERLRLDTSLGWSSLSAYGFQGGKGQATIHIDNGMFETNWIELPVNEGLVRVAPRIRLAPDPRELIIPGGRIVQNVRITPEMCNNALQYVAPVLSGVTTAQGKFSIDLETSRVPLADYKQSSVEGKFTVHTVEIGPGPLVQELAVLLNRPSGAKLSKESVVPFKLVDGRVYHRDLALVFPDLTIRTQGSVGLDRTLALMAEMPVPPKWIGNNPLGDAIKGQTIRLPIGGTLDQPKINQQALAQANAQFIGNAAGSVLKGELNKQLDRLLGPK
ncbi:MAG: DUF748 domain-containing protein [Pirellulales bacterium]|nr:DUF748 domain-containing protein [Pirellulales bacterium]